MGASKLTLGYQSRTAAMWEPRSRMSAETMDRVEKLIVDMRARVRAIAVAETRT